MSHPNTQPSKVSLRLTEDQLSKTHTSILDFLKAQVAAAADGAVVGLSGGVDSTLTGYLAVEALGAERVHGLVMPGEVSNTDHMSDAERMAQRLEISYDVIAIGPIVDTALEAYPEAMDDTMAIGNLRARIRAVLNYLVANHEDALVLGTGNRTEALTGYFTKYGDGAVDCLPIGNLYKQQVRQLARNVGVPDEIVEKTPTAELWAGQTDEDELGLDYDTLDAILALHIEGPDPAIVSIRDASPSDSILALDGGEPLPAGKTALLVGVPEREVRRIRQLVGASAHKRETPPTPAPLFEDNGP